MLKGLLGGVYHELKTLKTINKVIDRIDRIISSFP